MEHIGQVEVVSHGLFHVRVGRFQRSHPHANGVAGAEPETVFSLFNGVYSDPDSTNWRWWDHSYSPISNGMNVSHRQAFGKVDVVGGASFCRQNVPVGRHEQRARANLKFTDILPPSNTAAACKPSTSKWEDSSCGMIFHQRISSDGGDVQ